MNSKSPLRVAIVVSQAPVPVWIIQCLEEIETSKIAECILVIKVGTPTPTLRAGLRRRVRNGLFNLYLALDRRRFRRELQLLGSAALESVLPTCPVMNLPERPDARVLQNLRVNELDVILDPLSLVSHEALAPFSRYGIWGLRVGGNKPGFIGSSGFWEVAQNQPATETNLTVFRTETQSETIIDVLSVPTHAHSVARSQAYIYANIPALILRKMRALWDEGEAVLHSGRTSPLPGAQQQPGNLQMIPVLARMAKRAVVNRFSTTFYRGQWSLAYQWQDLPIHPGHLQYLRPPADRFWADPFPVQVDKTFFVFHEEVLFAAPRGTIALTMMDDQGRPAATVPILVKDYHLSYPFVFQWDGDFFMMPESAAVQRVDLYRCTSFPMQWKFEKTLFSDLAAYDSTLAYISGTWWLFTSRFPSNAATSIHELHLYHAPSPLGPWTPHRRNPVKRFNVISTRPAGRIFEVNGTFYRPAQDCSRRYGYGVSINRILRITPEDYEEVEDQRILPDWNSNVLGVHTLNQAGKMVMIDCLMWLHK